MVKVHSGTETDAEDLFQDGLDMMWRKVNDETFQLTSGFGTYFYAVCHNLWMKKLRRRKNWENIVLSGRISDSQQNYTVPRMRI